MLNSDLSPLESDPIDANETKCTEQQTYLEWVRTQPEDMQSLILTHYPDKAPMFAEVSEAGKIYTAKHFTPIKLTSPSPSPLLHLQSNFITNLNNRPAPDAAHPSPDASEMKMSAH